MGQLIKLLREERTEAGCVFVVSPFGQKVLSDGTTCNFDRLYEQVLAPTIESAGMTATRADGIYGLQGVLDTVWRGIQRAEVVIVDFTSKNPNVAAEFVMALLLGKRIIVITQQSDDIPTDVRGLYRYIPYDTDFESVDRLKEQLTQQLVAIREEGTTEMMLTPMPGSGSQPQVARVIIVEREFALVQSEDGRRGVLSNADVDYARLIPDMSKRYKVGDKVSGAFDVDFKGEAKYTLLAGQTNPWPALARDYTPGALLTGKVMNVLPNVGAFVRLAYGINGLIPTHSLMGTPVTPGDEVEVTVSRIDSDQRRVTLGLVGRGVPAPRRDADTEAPLPEVGLRSWCEVIKVTPESGQGGGYALVKIDGFTGLAMLHCTKMQPDVRTDLNSGALQPGEDLYVEVERVDPARRRVSVVELIPEDDSIEDAAAEETSRGETVLQVVPSAA